MISHALVVNGFASNLPALHRRKFDFTPGLNVLFGANGCGKSVLLKCIKAYCCLQHGGWSKLSENGELPGTNVTHFPQAFRAFTPTGECDTIVGWDGTATFFNDSDMILNDMTWFYNPDVLKQEGLTTEAEQIDLHVKKPSSGQTRIQKLNKIFHVLKNPPEFAVKGGPEAQYVRSLPNTGRVTILLDEPEKSLSIPKQIELFNFLKTFQNDAQIIITTHSPFILINNDINIIEMEPGYMNECKELIKSAATTL